MRIIGSVCNNILLLQLSLSVAIEETPQADADTD